MHTLEELVAPDRSELPGPAVTRIRDAYIDFMGVAFAGIHEPAYVAVREHLESSGDGDVPVPCGATGINARDAAIAWGTLGHSLDYDDVSSIMIGHPSTVLIPVALALGYRSGASGRDLLYAYASGYETIARVSSGAARQQYERGWHTTSTIGVLGSAMCASRMLTLSRDQTIQALSIATSLASGIQGNFGSATKPFHAGCAAGNGVLAAELAQKGLTAAAMAFEGAGSFFDAFGGRLLEPKDDRWIDVTGDLAMKAYPACGFAARPIDCAVELHEIVGGQIDRVERIDCVISSAADRILRYRKPESSTEAKFSLEFCVAEALMTGRLQLDQLSDDYVTSKSNGRSLADKVNREVTGSSDAMSDRYEEYAEMRVTMADGSVHRTVCRDPRGSPGNPFTADDIASKFMSCTQRVLPPETAERLLEQLNDLGAVTDVTTVMKPVLDVIGRPGVG